MRSQSRPCLCQIAANVNARREKVWHKHNALRPLRHAPGSALGNARLSQLQKRGFNDRLAARTQSRGDMMQIRVGLLLPAAVGDEQ
jgi:hypothetical protein